MSPVDSKCIGKLVVARTIQGQLYAVGKVIGYIAEPTLIIQRRTGEKVHWIAAQCEVLELEPEVAALLWPESVEVPDYE